MLPISNDSVFPPKSPPPLPIFIHTRSCFILSLLILLQTLLILLSQFSPFPSLSFHQIHQNPSLIPSPPPNPNPSPNCELGKFYIYDLPPSFNADIHQNCHKLNPWHSLCNKLSNSGYGPAASLSPLIPPSLSSTFFSTDQFSSELIFHSRLLSHPCRSLSPLSASAFYIPFYAGLSLAPLLWSPSSSASDRDRPCNLLLQFLLSQPTFTDGWDHFITMGRITWDFRRSHDTDWGSNCIHAPTMRNITRLLIERNPWDYFDVGVPYPTGFHPANSSQVSDWQRFVANRPRKNLFCFAGATRGLIKNDFRRILIDQCRSEPGLCRLVDCSGSTRCANGTSEILDTFLDSDFCLQPRGDSFTRRSIFDCMVAGSIPVFFWRRSAYLQYEWFLPSEPGSYSVFIHREAVRNGTASIKEVLGRFSREEVRRMREKVIEALPGLIYAKPGSPSDGEPGFRDAVDVAVDAVLTRIKKQKESGFWW